MTEQEAQALVKRRHPEWKEFARVWRWLLDSYEGGQRYRDAVYGTDRMGMPVRNLVRHKREYPDPHEIAAVEGSALYGAGLATSAANPSTGTSPDAAQYATDSDYEMRRARTPVPTFVREAVECHLAKVYGKEIKRDGPDQLKEWWEDCDGLGTCIGDWMESLIAPLFLTIGHLDILVDHPPAPEGAEITSLTDQMQAGLREAVASYILPENMLWWRLNLAGKYQEVLVQEFDDAPEIDAAVAGEKATKANYRLRYWNADEWVLLTAEGKILDTKTHPYGRVPIERVFFRRKPRCRNIGQTHYEGIAERQREFYNRDSELILSDTLQAHPLLQGPEDYVLADGTVPIGPSWLLPKKKHQTGTSISYEGFEVVQFPKDGAESIRQNKHDLRDDVDRDAKMTKPAGVRGTGNTTVAQSGVSKALDHRDGHELMTKVSAALSRLEETIAKLVLLVTSDGKQDDKAEAAIEIVYPKCFDLLTAQDLAELTTEFQGIIASAGECPAFEIPAVQAIARELFKGRDQKFYDNLDKSIEETINAKALVLGQHAEGDIPDERVDDADLDPAGNTEANAEAETNREPFYSSQTGNPLRGGL